jgi:hypothetical protein
MANFDCEVQAAESGLSNMQVYVPGVMKRTRSDDNWAKEDKGLVQRSRTGRPQLLVEATEEIKSLVAGKYRLPSGELCTAKDISNSNNRMYIRLALPCEVIEDEVLDHDVVQKLEALGGPHTMVISATQLRLRPYPAKFKDEATGRQWTETRFELVGTLEGIKSAKVFSITDFPDGSFQLPGLAVNRASKDRVTTTAEAAEAAEQAAEEAKQLVGDA